MHLNLLNILLDSFFFKKTGILFHGKMSFPIDTQHNNLYSWHFHAVMLKNSNYIRFQMALF